MLPVQKYLSFIRPSIVAFAALTFIVVALIHITPKGSNFATTLVHASSTNITGWAWSDYIGWVSFSGTATDGSPYGVTVNSASGALSGYAWSDSIGWINFGANSCGAQATLTNGTLSGWAQAPSNAGSWNGCIKLSDATAPAYGVTLSGTTFTGYAWGSDVVGWISFSGTASDGSPYKVVYGGSPTPTCTLSVAPNPAATNSSITLNYTTTNNPSSGTITDYNSNVIASGVTNTSGGVATTSPSSPGNYTYSMTVSSPAGTGSCTTNPALAAQLDVCTDIAGLQSSLPSGCTGPTPSPSGSCLPANYSYNGTSCVASAPSVNSFIGPTRVRKGNTATLSYNITNPPASCSITGTNGYASGAFSPVSDVTGQVTTSAITSNTQFSLTCGSVVASINVGITPTVIEK